MASKKPDVRAKKAKKAIQSNKTTFEDNALLKKWNRTIENQKRRNENNAFILFSPIRRIIFVILLLPLIAGLIKVAKVELHKMDAITNITICRQTASPDYTTIPSRRNIKKTILLDINTFGSAGLPLGDGANKYCNDVDILFLLIGLFCVSLVSAMVIITSGIGIVGTFISGGRKSRKDFFDTVRPFVLYILILLIVLYILFSIRSAFTI